MKMDSTGILRNRLSMLGDQITAKRSHLTGSFDPFMVRKGAVSTTNASKPNLTHKNQGNSFINSFNSRIHRTSGKTMDVDNVEVIAGKINLRDRDPNKLTTEEYKEYFVSMWPKDFKKKYAANLEKVYDVAKVKYFEDKLKNVERENMEKGKAVLKMYDSNNIGGRIKRLSGRFVPSRSMRKMDRSTTIRNTKVDPFSRTMLVRSIPKQKHQEVDSPEFYVSTENILTKKKNWYYAKRLHEQLIEQESSIKQDAEKAAKAKQIHSQINVLDRSPSHKKRPMDSEPKSNQLEPETSLMLTNKTTNDQIEISQDRSESDESLTGEQKCFERCWKCVSDKRAMADRADFQMV
jgi:hypothetical protein